MPCKTEVCQIGTGQHRASAIRIVVVPSLQCPGGVHHFPQTAKVISRVKEGRRAVDLPRSKELLHNIVGTILFLGNGQAVPNELPRGGDGSSAFNDLHSSPNAVV